MRALSWLALGVNATRSNQHSSALEDQKIAAFGSSYKVYTIPL